MDLKNILKIDDYQLNRLNKIHDRYRQMYLDPDNCSPMFIIGVPVANLPPYDARFNDPMVMLKTGLTQLRHHLEIEDDRLPTVRVEFGTGLMASAFGCETYVPNDNLPCAKGPVINSIDGIYRLKTPSKEDGLFKKLKMFTEVFLENIPEGVHIQHPDIQSPFNNAFLIRGNDFLTDFYDDPNAANVLLDKITDYMIEMVRYLKGMISTDREWFYDWGVLWKGAARISNCSTQMISPEMYTEYVLPRDTRLMQSIGGGRIHYCGTSGKMIDEFFKNPWITGLDFDPNYHDLWALAERAPRNMVFMLYLDFKSHQAQRLLAGDWPRKRNIIIQSIARSVEEGKEMLEKFRSSVPD